MKPKTLQVYDQQGNKVVKTASQLVDAAVGEASSGIHGAVEVLEAREASQQRMLSALVQRLLDRGVLSREDVAEVVPNIYPLRWSKTYGRT